MWKRRAPFSHFFTELQISPIEVHNICNLIGDISNSIRDIFNWIGDISKSAVFGDISNWIVDIFKWIGDICNSVNKCENGACHFHIYSLNCRYLQLKSTYLQFNWRYLQIQLKISSIELEISPNRRIWRYLQMNWRWVTLQDWRPIAILFSNSCGVKTTDHREKKFTWF